MQRHMPALKDTVPAPRPAGDCRAYQRMRSTRRGTLYSMAGAPVSPARLHDMSAAGACIEVDPGIALPARFTLRVADRAGQGDTDVACHLVWQHEALAGIRFF
ncbi:PilZ domain-containing protein [Hyphomonas johnsonii]|nr:PilZ domain-containing protein [Hyphomonas johnsonii]